MDDCGKKSYTYDESKQLVVGTDATGVTTTYAYNGWSNLIDPIGGVTITEYDNSDRVISYEDALGFIERNTCAWA